MKPILVLVLAFIFIGPPVWASSKAGVGEMYPTVDCVNRLGVSWYFTWLPTPRTGVTSAQFVPMIWSKAFDKKEVFEALEKNNPSGVLLGFNEPEQEQQSNMSVKQVVQAWPQLEATGFRLGSPGVSLNQSGKDWLRNFMSEAEHHGLKIDFICAHWYGDITKPDAVKTLKAEMETLHKEYGRPIWLTEFGVLDLYFKPGDDRNEIALRFLRGAVPMLERLPYVERYAWFTTQSWDGCVASALFQTPPRVLTPVGQTYRSLSGQDSYVARTSMH